MERVDQHEDGDIIELGVASVETQGAGNVGEIFGEPAAYEISDQ